MLHPSLSQSSPAQTQNNEQTPQKAFVCEICGKAFRFRSNLAEHRSVHTAVKPFVCKFCGKSSRLKGNLTKHILKHHKTEQKEYIGTDDYIIKKGKKSVKDPAAIEFLEKSMIVMLNSQGARIELGEQDEHGPASQQSADSELQNAPGTEFIDGQGILLSLGLEGGSLDLKAEAMEEGDQQEADPGHSHPDDNGNLFSFGNSANERLLESCESAISGGGADQHDDEGRMEQNDDEDGGDGGEECQSSGEQSPMAMMGSGAHFSLDTAGALASAACKALFSGQIDNKILTKALFGDRTLSTNGQIESIPSFGSQMKQHQHATNDEILRILQQVSSLTGQSKEQTAGMLSATAGEQRQQTDGRSPVGGSGSNKLATQCQLCGKHFRKPRDLITHLASNAHKGEWGETCLAAAEQPWSGSAKISNQQGASQSQWLGTSGENEGGGAGRTQLLRSGGGLPATTMAPQQSIRHNQQRRVLPNGEGNSELRELRDAVVELRMEFGRGNKLEQMLGQLDSRVCRLEKQLEMVLNSIYTLVQLQTGINNSVHKLQVACTPAAPAPSTLPQPRSDGHHTSSPKSADFEEQH